MDSSGWTHIEEEEEDKIIDPFKIVTIPEIMNKRLLAIEKLKGRVVERGVNTHGWGLLPDLVIEQIFGLLSIRD
ncbi:unnamed protein product, partial [Allacma fusca]